MFLPLLFAIPGVAHFGAGFLRFVVSDHDDLRQARPSQILFVLVIILFLLVLEICCMLFLHILSLG